MEDRPADALSALFQSHARKFVHIAVLLIGDEGLAEEVVQEAYLGLHRRWKREGPPESPEAYLRTSVVNGCRSALRRRQTAARARVLHLVPESAADAETLRREEQAAVLAALDRLSRRQREVLVLRFYLGLDDAEIGAALGVSRGTVSSTISRALRGMEDLLGGQR
ncbi:MULTISPECIES: RNA polymerase sigma factor [Actinomadura]|uniref:RNA polymerase sigma factor n=1 Tax=Actinomadura yumaensis TaxID=111807 RepID=A0ABW2CJB5_9ACTN|nr:sigma-70 family RNA polymerase sigma factor [Actinomadura sp. J1-007]MWK37883.1 sigma-70 family RNA polymerase sigma factor [Actinomadura sp. J1-007]